MYAKIEPSGTTVRNGKIQIRFSFYLEPGDARYGEHHVQVPIIPPGGYPGLVDIDGQPVDWEAYNAWVDSLPKQWQNNPFHNHFIYVNPSINNKTIKDLMSDHLVDFYDEWGEGKNLIPRISPIISDPSDIASCNTRVADIKNNISFFYVKK